VTCAAQAHAEDSEPSQPTVPTMARGWAAFEAVA
jgi:hypothetical protein